MGTIIMQNSDSTITALGNRNYEIHCERKWAPDKDADKELFTLDLTLTGVPDEAVDAWRTMRGGVFASYASRFMAEMRETKTHKQSIAWVDFVAASGEKRTGNIVSRGNVRAAANNVSTMLAGVDAATRDKIMAELARLLK